MGKLEACLLKIDTTATRTASLYRRILFPAFVWQGLQPCLTRKTTGKNILIQGLLCCVSGYGLLVFFSAALQKSSSFTECNSADQREFCALYSKISTKGKKVVVEPAKPQQSRVLHPWHSSGMASSTTPINAPADVDLTADFVLYSAPAPLCRTARPAAPIFVSSAPTTTNCQAPPGMSASGSVLVLL